MSDKVSPIIARIVAARRAELTASQELVIAARREGAPQQSLDMFVDQVDQAGERLAGAERALADWKRMVREAANRGAA